MDVLSRRLYLLFVVLAVIIEASGSDSNETSTIEHRQSRVTGRIVKVYTGTKPEPILCAGEGFQEDPNDCAVFYRCMKSGNGKYTVFRFQCGPGTVYDPETEICNHPRSTKRTQCGGLSLPHASADANEIEGIQHEIPSPISTNAPYNEMSTKTSVLTPALNPQSIVTSASTSKYPWDLSSESSSVYQSTIDYPLKPTKGTQTESPVFTTKVTFPATNTQQRDQRDNMCTTDGFMGDRQNCRKFYRCVANQRGGYTRYEFSCSELTIWDDENQSCNHAWAVKRSTCGRSDSNNINAISSTEITNSVSDSDKTIQQQTLSNYGDKIKPHKDSTAKQNQTQINEGYVISQTQPHMSYGDKVIQVQQIDQSKQTSETQTSETQTPVQESTTKETTSTQSNKGNMQNGNQCLTSGFMGDTNDCKKFYRCVENGRGGYTKYEFSCSDGTVWDQSIEGCNHAWAVKECGGKVTTEGHGSAQTELTTLKTTQGYTTTTTVSHNTSPESVATEDNDDSGYGKPNQEQSTTTTSTTIGQSTSTTSSSTTIGQSTSKNDCKSSGFIGDEKDCKIFYRCVENGKGGFTKYEFKCGEGTVWDSEIEACNHAWAVKKCGGSVSPSIETTTNRQTTSFTAHTQSTQSTSDIPTTQDNDYDVGYGSQNNNGVTTTTSITTKPTTPNEIGSTCKQSGFMGDANDCKKFYRCVENGNGGYTRYEFTCGEGTVWDSKIDACNHAWAVEKCGGSSSTVSHQESSSWQPEVSTEPGTSTPGINTGKPTHLPSITTTTTKATESTSSTHKNDCTKSGFMGDQNDCKKFYRCVDNGEGSYTKYEFTCGEGTLWDQEIEACNHAWAVKNCGSASTSSNTASETTSQSIPTLSDEIEEGYPSNNYPESGTTMQSTTHSSTTEVTKIPNESSLCTSSGFMGDKHDCKKFYRCVDNGQGGYTKYEFTCGQGTSWDDELQTCNHESSHQNCSSNSRPSTSSTTTQSQPQNGDEVSTSTTTETIQSMETTSKPSSSSTNQCESEGFFADPNDCKKFMRCVNNGKGGYTKYEFSCGDGTVWVQEILACDHNTHDTVCSIKTTTKPTSSVEPTQTTEKHESTSSTSTSTEQSIDNGISGTPSSTQTNACASEGFFADKNDCKQFHRCVDNGRGGYTKYDYTCGEGTAWDDEIKNCNHINQVKSCQGTDTTQPVMHDDENTQTTESSSTSSTTASSNASGENSQTSSTEASSTTKSPISSGDNSQTTESSQNKCNQEGYFGNKQDCKKFYRCVDNGKGGYTKYDFDCGEGTIWDQDITTCNHPQDVVNPSCSQNQDSGTTSTTSSSSVSSTTTENNSQSSSSNESSETTSSTTESGSQSSTNCSQEETSKKPDNTKVNCTKAGYFANPDDCKKFYRCVDWDGDGKRFSVYHFECGEGTIWDPAVETCNHEESVYPPRDCSGSQSQNENQPMTSEGTTATQQESTSTTTEKTTTTEQTTSQQTTTQQTTSEQTTTQQSTSSEGTTTQQSTSSEETTTQQSSTSESTTTQKPTTSEQTTTEKSTTSEPTTTQQSTTSEKTTTQQTTTSEQTTTEQSTTTQQSTTSETTTTQQSTTSESTTTQQTTTEQTTTQQSTPAEQTTQQQTTTDQTTTQQSTTSELTTTEQSTSEQTTQESTTTEFSTDDSTTQQSTTESSTTETSSDGSTTTEPVTESSTSTQETTSSEKECPETDDNQNLFVCPTSFRRHPKYCNMFYQCDEDDDTHDVKIAMFKCPNNTIYDENQTRCVEESKADKKCNGEIAQKRRFRRFHTNYKEPLVASKGSYACTSAGYLPFENESECSPAFLKCQTDKSNKLNGFVYQCPKGYVYWSVSKRCEPSAKIKDCKRSQNDWSERWQIPVETKNVAYK